MDRFFNSEPVIKLASLKAFNYISIIFLIRDLSNRGKCRVQYFVLLDTYKIKRFYLFFKFIIFMFVCLKSFLY
jgi:hypothetical protein